MQKRVIKTSLESLSFLRWRKDIAFDALWTKDRGFKAAFLTTEIKMVLYSVVSKLDSVCIAY